MAFSLARCLLLKRHQPASFFRSYVPVMNQPRASRITPDDIRQIAFTLIDRHGARALGYADLAVEELEGKGETASAEAWKALRSEIVDALEGRIGRAAGRIALH